MIAAALVLALAAAVSAQQTPLLALGDNRGNFVWSDFGSVARYEITVYEANIPSDKWRLLGHHAQGDWQDLRQRIHAFQDRSEAQDALSPATGLTQIWNCNGDTTWQKGSFWRVNCSDGYVAMGDVTLQGNNLKEPPKEIMAKLMCVKEELTEPCPGWNVKVWDNAGSIARFDASVWAPEASKDSFTEFYFVNTNVNQRPDIEARCLKNSAFSVL